MKSGGTTICPLSYFHLTGLAAIQISVILIFLKIELAVIPLVIFILISITAPFLTRFSFFLPIIYRGKVCKNEVALTFDDGPDPITTPHLLKLLSKYSINASFFVIGEKAYNHPYLIKRILSEGHSIGNHSYNHNPLIMVKSRKRLYKEIETAQRTLRKFGIVPLAFRPPVGITNPRLQRILLGLGMYCINFSCRAFDRGNRSINGLSRRILKKIKSGDIIMLHDVRSGRDFDIQLWLDEIELLIVGIGNKGINILPLSKIIGKDIMIKAEEKFTPNPIKTFYNGLALDYDREQFYSGVSTVRKKEYKLVLSRIPQIITSSDRVLELGAGTGIFTIPISKYCKEIVAVDISNNMLIKLKEKAEESDIKNITCILGDYENVNFNKTFDVICSFSSFEYISDLENTINSLSNYLKPGGILYFTTAHCSLFRFFTQIGNALRQGLWLKARSKNEIKKMLHSASFHKIDISCHLFNSIFSGGMLLEALAEKKDR